MHADWADVPVLDGVWRPGFADGGGFVDEYAGAGRCKRRLIKVEGAVYLCPRRELGVDARRAEEIEGEKRLGKGRSQRWSGKLRSAEQRPAM